MPQVPVFELPAVTVAVVLVTLQFEAMTVLVLWRDAMQIGLVTDATVAVQVVVVIVQE